MFIPVRWVLLLSLLTVSIGGQAQSASSAVVAIKEMQPAVYYTAEVMPAFPGGEEALRNFIRTKLQYPQEALNRRVGGKVYVSFLVTEEGRIRDATIVKGLGAGLDEEALRLVRIMPWWSPGKNANQPVPVMYTLPIVFRGVY
jgi:protein TonB